MKKILIGPSTFSSTDNAPVKRLLDNGFEVIRNPFGRKLTAGELKELLSGIEGIIAGLEILDGKTLKNSSLKVISRCGAGISNIDVDAARRLGIKVFYTPDAPTDAVAELTVGAMISAARYLAQMDSDLHKGKWSKRIGIQISGSVVAIIGFGRIGRKLAKLLAPFNAEIIAVDPDLEGVIDDVPVVSLKEALPRADIITIHAAGEDVILGEREFGMMKEKVFIMNAARGGVIDEDALMRSLDSGRVAGAWLDCFREEPYAGPLIRYPQVILTPHVGSYTEKCRSRMEMEAADNIIKFFNGER